MKKQNPIGYILIALFLIFLLAGCDLIEHRLADGTAVAAGKDAGGLFSSAGNDPVGEGGGSDEWDQLSPEEMATALAQTLVAGEPLTPQASPTDTLVPEVADESTATLAPSTEEDPPTPTVPVYQFTALAQTLTSMVTTPGANDLVETPEPDGGSGGGDAAAVDSPTPVPVEPDPCNSFRFVAHVTYPSGSVVEPETYFYKTWRIQNTGTCTWNSGYSLVFYDGYQLGGTTPLVFGGNVVVAPGQYVEVTNQLYTPPQPGTYFGYWVLKDSYGNLFAGGENADQYLVVEVIVPGNPAPIFTDPITTAPPFTPAP